MNCLIKACEVVGTDLRVNEEWLCEHDVLHVDCCAGFVCR